MPTLTQYRAFVADQLGAFQTRTASSSSTTAQLVDTKWPVTSSLSQDDLYADMWLFRPAAATASDKVRIVKTYTPSSGILTPDTPWTIAPANGEAYELHGVMEPLTALANCINQGLKRCILADVEVTGTPIALAQRHSLLTIAPWLHDPQAVRQVGRLFTGELRDQVDPFMRTVRGRAVMYGGGVEIQHPGQSFNVTDTLYISVQKPAYDHCRANGGTYGDQSGLSLETDEAPVEVEWVGWAAVVEAWRAYGHLLEASARQRLIPDRVEAASMFSERTSKSTYTPMLTFRPISYGGPRNIRTGTSSWR